MNIVGRVILVLFVAALAGAAAIAFSASQPKEYTSNMRFGYGRLVSPELQLLGQGFAEPQLDANIRTQTESAEVNSFDVAVATAKAAPRLGLGANGIAAHVTAQPIRDTLTVLLTARASTPQLAARLAAAYGKQYLKLRRQHERQRATTVKKALQNQLAALTKVDKRGVNGALRSQINTIEVLREVGSGTPR